MKIETGDILVCISNIENSYKLHDLFSPLLDIHYNPLYFRKAKKLERIAYVRGLSNLDDISWDIPTKPTFAISLSGYGDLNTLSIHQFYEEICEYLGFSAQLITYKTHYYAGYIKGSAKTWLYAPSIKFKKFENLNSFIDHIFTHWAIINFSKKEGVTTSECIKENNINNQLNINKNEKLLTKISGPTQRRSYYGTRQTTSRREPNSVTERCISFEKGPEEIQERAKETIRSKRNRLQCNIKLSRRYKQNN